MQLHDALPHIKGSVNFGAPGHPSGQRRATEASDTEHQWGK